MQINPQLVKQLREETDAPMMECKQALVEAEGDFDKAKQILREKGQVAAAKRAGRATNQGIAMSVVSPDAKTAASIVLECETDFVARNDQFVALAQKLANAFLNAAPGEDPKAVQTEDGPVGELVEKAVAVIRENIQLKKAVRFESEDTLAVYNHHDRKKTAVAELSGSASNLAETGYQVAVQTVAFPPRFIRREEVPQDVIAQEIETEKQRAINDGKPPQVAENIAKGRVNKEFYQAQVLLEQPFYLSPDETLGQYLEAQAKAGGGEIGVVSAHRFAVGEE